MEKILLIGFGGHAKSVVDSLESAGIYEIAGFVDKREKKELTYKNYRFIGTDDMLLDLRNSGISNAFITLGYVGKGILRQNLVQIAEKAGFDFPTIIDPTAVIAIDAKVGKGTFVGKNAVINADATIGQFAIINTASVVEHDAMIGNFSHIAVNATVCGGCDIGEHVLVGAGATVLQNVNIGSHAVIGAGSVVIKSIAANSRVAGVPSRDLGVNCEK